MRWIILRLQVFFFAVVLGAAGCESLPPPPDKQPQPDAVQDTPPCVRYAFDRVDILPLTELKAAVGASGRSKLNVYVSLLDSFSSQVKAPAVFRFELYEHLRRSAQPKGHRIFIWPDIDLTDPVNNNQYWRDFLRAYEFSLDLEPAQNPAYILQVTCLSQGAERRSAEYSLELVK